MLLFYQELFVCTLDDVSESRLSEDEFYYLKRLHRCFVFLSFKEVIDDLELYCQHGTYEVFHANLVLLKKLRVELVCLEDISNSENQMNTFCDESIRLTKILFGRLSAVKYSPDFFTPPPSSDPQIEKLKRILGIFLTKLANLKENISESSYFFVESAHL